MITRKAIIKMEKKEMQWIVQDMMPYIEKPILIAGSPGSGKSLLGLQLASCIAYGVDFLGHRTKKNNTLYLSLQDDIDTIIYRTQRSQAKINPDGNDGNCYIECKDTCNYHFSTVSNGAVKPTKDLQQLKADIINNSIKVVVIDHLSKVFDGDQNNRNQVNQFGNLLNVFCREAHCMVIVLAHTNKTDNQYSGSSANAGIYRQAFLLTYNKTKNIRTISMIKSNNTGSIEPITYTIDQDLFCNVIANQKEENEIVSEVANILSDGEWHTRQQICKLIGQEIQTKAFGAIIDKINNITKHNKINKETGKKITHYKKGDLKNEN